MAAIGEGRKTSSAHFFSAQGVIASQRWNNTVLDSRARGRERLHYRVLNGWMRKARKEKWCS